MRHTSLFVASPFLLGTLFLASLATAQTPTAPPGDAPPAEALPAPAASPAAAPAPAPVVAPAASGALETAPPLEKPAPEDRSVYLAISPLHLFLPMVELTGEVRVHRNIGLAAVGGYGQVSVEGMKDPFKVYEVGGQFVGYPVGHFDHGMQVGVEVMYLGVATSQRVGDVKVLASGEGLAAGPMVGYKLATDLGFSFNVQAGAQYMVVRAEASSGTTRASQTDPPRIIPLLNINVGWSF